MRPAKAAGPPPSLFDVVRRAVDVTDPSGEFGVGDLLQYVQDSDEPVTAHADIEEELAEITIRAEFDGHPPDNLRRWLEEQGVPV